MAVKRNRKKHQAKKNIDEIFKKFDHNQNQRVSIRQFTEVEFWSLIFFLIVLVLHKISQIFHILLEILEIFYLVLNIWTVAGIIGGAGGWVQWKGKGTSPKACWGRRAGDHLVQFPLMNVSMKNIKQHSKEVCLVTINIMLCACQAPQPTCQWEWVVETD